MGQTALNTEHLEQRLADLRADLAAAKQAAEAASERAREATVRGDADADAAVRARAEARAKVETLAEAIRDVEGLIPAAKEAEGRAAATRRMLGIKRAYTSLLDTRDKDIERIEEAASALVDAVKRFNGRHLDLDALLIEALVLEDRFGIEAPDFARPVRPSGEERVKAALRRASEAKPADTDPLPPRLWQLPFRSGIGLTLRRALGRIAGTPASAILERAGLGILGDGERWEARRRAEHDAARDRGDAARRTRMAEVDAWLRRVLADGPVARERILAAAKEANVALYATNNTQGASVAEARARLGVLPLETRDGAKVPFWCLPDAAFDADLFAVVEAESPRSRQMGAALATPGVL